jgi:DNA-binding MarR family transcriptional regulator
MSRQWSRSELAQQLRNEIMGYFGAASDFDERVAKELKLSRTDVRCLDLIGRLGPLTAGRLAEESGLTTGAVTFILDRLEEAGMVTRRRDTEDRRRVWVEIVPQAKDRLADLQQPVAEEMRQVAQRFKADELEVVRDFMRRAKEVFQRQMQDVVHEAMHDGVDEARASAHEAAREARNLAHDIAREARKMARDVAHEATRGTVHGSGDAGGTESDRREGPATGK